MRVALMQRVIFSSALLLSTALYALSVNEAEVKSKSGITFINSPDTSGSDSVAAIRGIGVSLARDGNSGNAYRVIHAIGQGSDKFDADIIVIGPTAKVVHIKNIRRILAGYLQERYRYSAEEAKALSVFITYYNGFYRKNLGYFKERYKPEVLKHLSAANAGLDRSYKGWPGKSRIVIPLSEEAKPDAGTLGEKAVMDKVRREEKDMGVKEREQITKLQEKELKKKEERVAKEKAEQTRRRDEIAKKEERLKEDKKRNEQNPDPGDKAKKDEELKKKEEELTKEKETLQKEEEKITKEEKKIEEKKAELAQNKQDLQTDKNRQQRRNETPAQREARLAAKEAEIKKREEEQKNNRPQDSVFGGKLYYLRVRDYSTDGKYRNDFYIIDPKARKIKVKSPYTGIVGKKFDVVDKDVVVIGEKKSATSVQHYLVKLDGETLIDKQYGSDEVFWRGFVEVRENEIYAILNKNGTFYLGKFDKNLKLLQRSEVALHEDTFFSFHEDTIYVNGADRKIEVLNRSDLKSAGSILP
jgi:hypothetical protein